MEFRKSIRSFIYSCLVEPTLLCCMLLLLSHLSCPTLCNPVDSSPPGSAVPGILQARTLEWVAISFSNEWMWKVKVKLLSHARLLATPWTAAYQAPLSMRFSRQEYWSGVPLPSPLIPMGSPEILLCSLWGFCQDMSVSITVPSPKTSWTKKVLTFLLILQAIK